MKQVTLCKWLQHLKILFCFLPLLPANARAEFSGPSGTVIAWGDNRAGQTNVPAGLFNVVAVASGDLHSLALKADGTVIGWGQAPASTPPTGLSQVTAIAAGGSRSLALKEDGTVVIWGENVTGLNAVPANLNGVKAIAQGASHSLAMKSDGTVVAWGDNAWGQSSVPSTLTKVIAIAAGASNSLAITPERKVVAWGCNVSGQSSVPTANWALYIAGGLNHSLAGYSGTDSIRAWGDNAFGQCNPPANLNFLWTIAAGAYHNVVVLSNRTVVAWGKNNFNQAAVPPGISNVLAVAAGANHSLALVASPPIMLIQPLGGAKFNTGARIPLRALASSGHSFAKVVFTAQRIPTGLQRLSPPLTLGEDTAEPFEMVWTNPGDGSYNLVAEATDQSGMTLRSAAVKITVGSLLLQPRLNVIPEVSGTLDGKANVSLQLSESNYSSTVKAVEYYADGQLIFKTSTYPFTGVWTDATVGSHVITAVTIDDRDVRDTSSAASIEVAAPSLLPVVRTAPQSQTALVGQAVTLKAEAGGTGPFTYQWRKNGLDIPGATFDTITLDQAQLGDAGAYTVVISNAQGTATSQQATLYVYSASTDDKYTFNLFAGVPGMANYIDGLPATVAWFNNPSGMAADAAGNVYVADTSNHVIRKITRLNQYQLWSVSTLAGVRGATIARDGPATSATFLRPTGVAVDKSGNVYVADAGSHTIRKIDPSGIVTTVAGLLMIPGTQDGVPQSSRLNQPQGVAVDNKGNVYVADTGNHAIRKISFDVSTLPWISTLGGSKGTGGYSDGDGLRAMFDRPQALAVDNAGNVYVADTGNYLVRKMSPLSSSSSYQTTTVAGMLSQVGLRDGPGSQALFTEITGIAVDQGGNLFVTCDDTVISNHDGNGWSNDSLQILNGTLRKITPGNEVYTLQSIGQPGAPVGVAVDSNGTLFFSTQSQIIYRGLILPRIVTQPINYTVIEGGSASFKVVAAGTPPLQYQWYKDSTQIPGATAATFEIATTKISDGGQYSVVVRNDAGTVTSASPTLRIIPGVAPQITSTFYNGEAVEGTTAEFRIQASGTEPLTYQWYKNGIAISGATAAQLALKAVSSADAATYQVEVANTVGRVKSGLMPLIISVPPHITAQPLSVTTALGGMATFTMGVYGTEPLMVQWFHNGKSLGAAGSGAVAWTINNAQASDAGSFFAIVTNRAGAATSEVATLTIAVNSQLEDYYLATFAGRESQHGFVDGVGRTARFWQPDSMVFDPAGNIWIADLYNHTVRKMNANGSVVTVAGDPEETGAADGPGRQARFNGPAGLAIDAQGNVYVADNYNHTIRKITPDGTVTTIAGSAGRGGVTDGQGSAARFNSPSDVLVDGQGQILVADTGNRCLRKVSPAGVVTTYAGKSNESLDKDGSLAEARFKDPVGLAMDRQGNIYVSENNACIIRKITPQGAVTTLAGQSGVYGAIDGLGTAARLGRPHHLALDNLGNLFVACGDGTIRAISTSGLVTTVLGKGATAAYQDGWGGASRMREPAGVVADPAGRLYIADSDNQLIRLGIPRSLMPKPRIEVQPRSLTVVTGAIPAFSVLASYAEGYQWRRQGTNIPGANAATLVLQNVKTSDAGSYSVMVSNAAGQVASNPAILTVDSSYGIDEYSFTTLAGLARTAGSVDGTGTEARFYRPGGIALDADGNLWVADTSNQLIRKVTPGGTVTTVAGQLKITGTADGAGAQAQFNQPSGLSVSAQGMIYICDTLNHTIRQMTPAGVVSTLAGTAGRSGLIDGKGSAARFYSPWGIAVDSSGLIWVADRVNCAIRRITADGVVTTFAGQIQDRFSQDGRLDVARFIDPAGIGFDRLGNVFVTERAAIRRILPDATVTTLAGDIIALGTVDAWGENARFNIPWGPSVDAAGNLYVVSDDHTVRKISPGGMVSTIAGKAGASGITDGIGTQARFSSPNSVAVDRWGNLFIADTDNNTLRKGSKTRPALTFSAGVVSADAGATVEVPVSVSSFKSILNFQFSVHWDPQVAQFVGVDKMNLKGINTGVNDSEHGILTVLWDTTNTEGETLPDDLVLFVVKLQAIGKMGQKTLITLNGQPTEAAAATVRLAPVPLLLAPGQLTIADTRLVQGTINYYSGDTPVAGVTVKLAAESTHTARTELDGSFRLKVPPSAQVDLTPALQGDEPPARGVTSIDVSLVRAHILNTRRLDSPYKLLAADVNGSGSINASDLSLIQFLILGAVKDFPAGSWRFIPAGYEFKDLLNPWSSPTNLHYASISESLERQDFLGIKHGDVNGDWASSLRRSLAAVARPLRVSAASAPTAGMELQAAQLSATEREKINLPVWASPVQGLTSLQFTLQWDPTVLRFLGTSDYGLPGLGEANWGTSLAESGLLTFAWQDATALGIALADQAILFNLQFEVVGAGDSSSAINFTDDPTLREAAINFAVANFSAQAGQVMVQAALPPKIETWSMSNREIKFDVTAPSNSFGLVLERSEDLKAWTPILTNATPGGRWQISQPITTDVRAQFFRVRPQ